MQGGNLSTHPHVGYNWAMKKPLFVLFDGNAIVHRAYHAMEGRPLTVRKTGEVVSAVYGFAQMLLKALGELKPTYCAIAFDKKGPTFRHELYDQYKAHRPPTPEDLISQMERVKDLVLAFNIPIFEVDGYEADDILGTLSLKADGQGVDSVIVTGDADAMQLVSSNIKVLYPKPRGTFSDTLLYDKEAVRQKFGVGPEHIADYKALVGDPSDNIPGVSGIGGKTAVKLIGEFGSVEDIYDHLNQVTPAKLQEKLRDNEDIARKSKVLARIVTDMPLELALDECRLSCYDRERVLKLFQELEFRSLMPKIPQAEGASATVKVGASAPSQEDYHTVTTPADLDRLVNRLGEVERFAFDTETTSLNAMTAELVGLSLSPTPGESYYVPVGHVGWGDIAQLPLKEVIDRLKPHLEDTASAKTAHNGKYDMMVLYKYGIKVANLACDTMIAAHLLGEKGLGLKNLSFTRLGVEMTPIAELIGTGKKQLTMSQVEINRAAKYACADADMTGRLAEMFQPELEGEGLWRLFADVEMPLVPVLMDMERNGIALDKSLMGKMGHRIGEQLLELQRGIYEGVGHQFNINSPRQLGQVLFEELKLPANRRTKEGYSTGAAVLEGLRGAHPAVELILEYRQLAKLKSTYIDALPRLVNPDTGRVHTSFNQTKTATGRLSSSDPNLQNIPVRGETGREIRRTFIAPEGNVLLGGDYSQIDLRALAHLSQDTALMTAFEKDEDIHSATAAQLFDVEPGKVTKDMRRLAKTVNFGVIYGISDYGLEQATELSREEAAQFIAAYFARHPGVKEYMEKTKEEARRKGSVKTILGRKRFIAEIGSNNRQVREAAERMAINMPVQGTSADIIKVAMIALHRQMREKGLKSKMLLQVHDELVFEVPQEEIDTMKSLVPEAMSAAIKLDVPLKVDIKVGDNWGEME